MKKGAVKQYFPGANSCQGYYSLLDSNINDLEKLIILKGGPGTGKSVLLSYLAEKLIDSGYNAELLRCSSDAESLDGVVFRDIGAGVIDGSAPHVRDPLYPGVVDRIVNLGDFWDEGLLNAYRKEIISLTNENRDLYRKTYEKMALAKKHHDTLEQLYIEGMNWTAVDLMIDGLIRDLLDAHPAAEGRHGKETHRFAGGSTPQGPVNYLDELLAGASRRFIVKGRAGTGKSTMTKRIAQAAQKKGFDVEYYHCSFDPHSIDNIFIPALGICLIDGTAPHEKEAGPNDAVIDMFQFMSAAVYQRNLSLITETDEIYRKTFVESWDILKQCKLVHDELEGYYIRAMDFSGVDRIRQLILEEILAFAEN